MKTSFYASAFKFVRKGNEILILSGEGEQGCFEVYEGKRTEKALKLRLTKEKCHGDRWAKVYVFSHENDGGKIYIDLETEELRQINIKAD